MATKANMKKQQERKKMLVRILCVFLAFLMVASAIFAIVQMFIPAEHLHVH